MEIFVLVLLVSVFVLALFYLSFEEDKRSYKTTYRLRKITTRGGDVGYTIEMKYSGEWHWSTCSRSSDEQAAREKLESFRAEERDRQKRISDTEIIKSEILK